MRFPATQRRADVQSFDRQQAEPTGAPSPVLSLALFPVRGGMRAVGVINGVMQQLLLLHPELLTC